MASRPTIFISYAHEGMDRSTLTAFERCLHEATNGDIEILIDNRLEIGDQLSKFIARLQTCDAAVVMLTPEYRARIETRKGGVYEEYKIIKSRIENVEERIATRVRPSATDYFVTFPVLFSGTKETSCPRDIEDKLFANMVYFQANKTSKGEIVISSKVRQEHEEYFISIASRVASSATLKLNEFREEYKRRQDALLVDTKAEHMRVRLTSEQWRQILVTTRAFGLTSSQKSLILVGRKGSGKSTIVQHLYDESPETYKDRIHIDFEKFKLQPLYDLIYSPRIKSEIKSIYELVGFFRCSWTLFMFTACGMTLLREAQQGKLTSEQLAAADAVLSYLKHSPFDKMITPRGIVDYFMLYSHCFELVAKDLDLQISKTLEASQVTSMTEIISQFQEHAVVERLVGPAAFGSFIDVVRLCRRRFLLSIDGFDTKFDEFRRQTINTFKDLPKEASERTQFEVDWLRGLFHTVLRLKREFFEEGLFEKINFCITIPKDRYMEARKEDRDGFIYDDRMSYLDWRARELFIMIRKRLDVMNNFYHKDGEAVERLWVVLNRFYPAIPRKLRFKHRAKSYEVDLHNYILRHTFWRPRDILKYYARILSYHDTNMKHKRKVDVEGIRHCIADATAEIVETEFLNEFRGVCYNLDDIIRRFVKCPQILDHGALYKLIEEVDFMHADDTYKPRSFREKMEFLYKIGFLGIKLPEDLSEDWRALTREIFYFSDGDAFINSLSEDEMKSVKFIVHPVFCEKLRIDTRGSDLVLMYSDEYLERNDSL